MRRRRPYHVGAAPRDTDGLTEAKARLTRFEHDHALQGTYVAYLGGIVQDGAALTVPTGLTLDPAAPGARRLGVGVVVHQRGLPFFDARGELLLQGGADHLRPIGGEHYGRVSPVTREQVARPDEDAKDRAVPGRLSAALIERKPCLVAARLGHRHVALRAAGLALGILGLEIGQALALDPLELLELTDLHLAGGHVNRSNGIRRQCQLLTVGQQLPRSGQPAPRELDNLLLAGNPSGLLRGELPRLLQLKPAQLHGGVRLGQADARGGVVKAEDLGP